MTKTIGVFCERCGECFFVHPYRIKDGVRFCTEGCKIGWLASRFSGERSPHWNGGALENYGRDWDKISSELRLKMDSVCEICFQRRPKSTVIHHIIPFKWFLDNFGRKYAEDHAHILSNLILLCRTCHMKVEHNYRREGFPKSIDMREYPLACLGVFQFEE